jgi:hypothetical protein
VNEFPYLPMQLCLLNGYKRTIEPPIIEIILPASCRLRAYTKRAK